MWRGYVSRWMEDCDERRDEQVSKDRRSAAGQLLGQAIEGEEMREMIPSHTIPSCLSRKYLGRI